MTDGDAAGPTFRGERFERVDFSGALLRDCDLRDVKIVDSMLQRVSLSGDIAEVVVNDVDVTAFVEAQLDRRHPERALARDARTAEELRAAWSAIEEMWAATIERARALPEAALSERVDGEWSLVETLRHLVYATDAWVQRPVLDREMPFSPIGLAQSGYPADAAAAIGLDVTARPSFDAVLEVRLGRMELVRSIVESITDEELERMCVRPPAPLYPDTPHSVRDCVRVVMNEECEHHRYAVRDLAVLERGR